MVMAELDSTKDLVGYFPDQLFLQSAGVSLKVVKDCVVNKLKHEVQFLFPTKILD
jgi:hypothetical protein